MSSRFGRYASGGAFGEMSFLDGGSGEPKSSARIWSKSAQTRLASAQIWPTPGHVRGAPAKCGSGGSTSSLWSRCMWPNQAATQPVHLVYARLRGMPTSKTAGATRSRPPMASPQPIGSPQPMGRRSPADLGMAPAHRAAITYGIAAAHGLATTHGVAATHVAIVVRSPGPMGLGPL